MTLAENIIKRDIHAHESSRLAWSIPQNKPCLKQIYGTFFPPYHMKYASIYVKSVHSNPHAHHDTNGYIKSKLESMNITEENLESFISLGEKLKRDSLPFVRDELKIREENEGVSIWTPYHNGFYINEIGYKILKCCDGKHKMAGIASFIGCDMETIKEFLLRLVASRIIDVHA